MNAVTVRVRVQAGVTARVRDLATPNGSPVSPKRGERARVRVSIRARVRGTVRVGIERRIRLGL